MATRLSYNDRKDIELMIKDNLSFKAICMLKNISRQGLLNERNRGKDENGEYSAEISQKNLQRSC